MKKVDTKKPEPPSPPKSPALKKPGANTFARQKMEAAQDKAPKKRLKSSQKFKPGNR